jgi:hypothetical protein
MQPPTPQRHHDGHGGERYLPRDSALIAFVQAGAKQFAPQRTATARTFLRHRFVPVSALSRYVFPPYRGTSFRPIAVRLSALSRHNAAGPWRDAAYRARIAGWTLFRKSIGARPIDYRLRW